MTAGFPALRAAVVLSVSLAASTANAELPPENTCPTLIGSPGLESHEDAVPILLREGMVLDTRGLLALRHLIPREIWHHRDQFFHEGMRMELGPCHRRYPVPSFYHKATQEFAGTARVDKDGNLRDYTAGVPFPPDAMDPDDPKNGVRWAWNMAQRWRGAGAVGSFRLADMPSSMGSVQIYKGSSFFIRTQHRSDLRETDFAVPEADKNQWISGGRFDEPFNVRHLAWRQMRPVKAEVRYEQSDDIFVYVPTMRKMRRAASTHIDGVYMPRYRVAGQSAGGSVPVGAGAYGPTGALSLDSAVSHADTEHIRRGFVGSALRPNAHLWRILEEREVLAPINASRSGYPIDNERNFGPSGLSVGSDRWEVRWAIVLQSQAKERGNAFDSMTIYVDYQTLQPLYWISKRGRGRLVDVGILVHRFSGDVAEYPAWPDGQKAFVFDPVAAVFYANDGSGWRRESYDIRSTPAKDSIRRRFMSSAFLLRGR